MQASSIAWFCRTSHWLKMAFLAVAAAGSAVVAENPAARAQFVCGSTTGGEGGEATGSARNFACGSEAKASGVDGENTAMGYRADARGDSSRNTATGGAADASGLNSQNVAIGDGANARGEDRKSTRLNSSH